MNNVSSESLFCCTIFPLIFFSKSKSCVLECVRFPLHCIALISFILLAAAGCTLPTKKELFKLNAPKRVWFICQIQFVEINFGLLRFECYRKFPTVTSLKVFVPLAKSVRVAIAFDMEPNIRLWIRQWTCIECFLCAKRFVVRRSVNAENHDRWYIAHE